jgi:hypothetical protein
MNVVDTDRIFNVTEENFEQTAMHVFHYQLKNSSVYNKFYQLLPMKRHGVSNILQIPFLPVSFFKTHNVSSFDGKEEVVFQSSGTSGMSSSKHFVKSLALYEQSFMQCFRQFYGEPSNYAFLCLLPSYLERQGSSLVYMAQKLIEQSSNADSGFFLESHGRLSNILSQRERSNLPTFLLGVTFALLDFAADAKLNLKNTIVMETGGMKGRREELTRAQVHELLKESFQVSTIHSEYGMTELLSQAYSKANGLFKCPPWMKVLVRDEDDPFNIKLTGSGLLCIIDLANTYSCSFIETADVGKVYADGSFEVLGRMDNSDLRGCSLLVL